MIDRLNALVAAWKAQFDNPPDLSFSWRIDISGVLRLNEVEICPTYELANTDAFDAEWLRLDLRNGNYVVIEIDWPYGGDARISEIVIHKVMDKGGAAA